MWQMDLNQQKEQFSHAYVRAVASVVGLRISKPEVDDDSIDLTLAGRGGGGSVRSPKIDLQLKCTGSPSFQNGQLTFVLSAKNYDDLRDPAVMVPRILVVVVVPENLAKWLLHDETRLALHHCGYWLSLRSAVSKPGQVSVTVHLPCSQQFDVVEVTKLMSQVAYGNRL